MRSGEKMEDTKYFLDEKGTLSFDGKLIASGVKIDFNGTDFWLEKYPQYIEDSRTDFWFAHAHDSEGNALLLEWKYTEPDWYINAKKEDPDYVYRDQDFTDFADWAHPLFVKSADE